MVIVCATEREKGMKANSGNSRMVRLDLGVTHNYVRHGTTILFAEWMPPANRACTMCHSQPVNPLTVPVDLGFSVSGRPPDGVVEAAAGRDSSGPRILPIRWSR
jgi:hypothetical protein